ncbi:MAG: alpha/beta hydrolase [Pelagimonas sp.]|jgi:pimeloyl-ACP methyl ester carboxylesterase|nr:alpha/beta hydrolase [Pelagimonas sp.]
MTWTTRQRSEVGALAAITTGAGPDVLMIHGVGLRAEAWNAQMDALAVDHRVVAVDLPGHGHSPLPAGDLDLAAYTDAIAAGMTGPAMVMGHSMGAMIALDLAIRYPHLVTGVVALNAIYQRSTAAKQAVRARAASLDGVTMADPSGTLDRWFDPSPSPERQACATWLQEVNPAAYRMAYDIFAREDGPAPAKLADVACPALFLTGQDEPNSTPDMSRAMAGIVPQGRAQIIENAAHMMPMTHADEVNAHLRRFATEIRR